MNKTDKIVQKITEAIQEKKGKRIVIADLTTIEDTICNYFVICEGNSPSQVTAIVDSIKDYVRKETGEKGASFSKDRSSEEIGSKKRTAERAGTGSQERTGRTDSGTDRNHEGFSGILSG